MSELKFKDSTDPSYLQFNATGMEVLKLDKEGFHFMGETIKDAGKAYDLFMLWLTKAYNNEQTK